MNNPFKLVKDLSPTELEFEERHNKTVKLLMLNSMLYNLLLINTLAMQKWWRTRSRQDCWFPFIYQKRVELDNGVQYDAYISFSLALLGNQKNETEYNH
jgi:hypothetical protein